MFSHAESGRSPSAVTLQRTTRRALTASPPAPVANRHASAHFLLASPATTPLRRRAGLVPRQKPTRRNRSRPGETSAADDARAQAAEDVERSERGHGGRQPRRLAASKPVTRTGEGEKKATRAFWKRVAGPSRRPKPGARRAAAVAVAARVDADRTRRTAGGAGHADRVVSVRSRES
jgi:hypothetical protein